MPKTATTKTAGPRECGDCRNPLGLGEAEWCAGCVGAHLRRCPDCRVSFERKGADLETKCANCRGQGALDLGLTAIPRSRRGGRAHA